MLAMHIPQHVSQWCVCGCACVPTLCI